MYSILVTTLCSDYDLCMTKDCVKAAATIIKSMDTNINPCHDFYSYSCGGFIDNTNIPQGKHGVSTMGLMSVKFPWPGLNINKLQNHSR